MFDRVVIARPEIVDAGLLAESMLFYQCTTLVLDGPRLESLLASVDPAILADLMDAGDLKIRFVDGVVGALGTTAPFDLLTLRARDPGDADDPDVTLHALLDEVIRKKLGRRGPAGVRIVNKFRRHVSAENLTNSFLEAARNDLTDGLHVEQAVQSMVARRNPEIRSGGRFRVARAPGGLDVDTDIDFSHLSGPGLPLTLPRVLATFAAAHQLMYFAADERSELAVEDGDTMLVLRAKVRSLLEARQRSQGQIADFQDLVLEGRAVGDAINAGRRTFAQFAALMDVARPFKKWLAGVPSDERLAREYLRAVTAKTWLASERGKAFRWAAISAAGITAGLLGDPGVSGAVLSALDTVYAEKLRAGWRPDQFVIGPMKGFAQ